MITIKQIISVLSLLSRSTVLDNSSVRLLLDNPTTNLLALVTVVALLRQG